MKTDRKQRTWTIIGVLTMVAGTCLLTVSPAHAQDEPAGQNPAAECAEAAERQGIAYSSYSGAKWEGNPPYELKAADESYNGFDAQLKTEIVGEQVKVTYEEATAGADLAVVKQALGQEDIILEGLTADDFLTSDPDLSYVTLCHYEELEATLTVEKEVTGAVPAEGWTFDFDITDDHDVTLSGAQADASDAETQTVDPGEYTITEAEDGGADFVSWTCTDDNDGDAVLGSSEGEDLSAEVTLEDGDAVTCTFVNNYPEVLDDEVAKLTVVKVVTGDVPDEWAFDFDVTDGASVDVDVPLSGTAEVTSDSQAMDLDPGTYSVSEVEDEDADFVSVVCTDDNDGDAVLSSSTDPAASVTLEDGDAVTCTFTNNYPEPLESTVEEDDTSVLGVSTTRTLPQTGSSGPLLPAAGLALVALGLSLTVGARRLAR